MTPFNGITVNVIPFTSISTVRPSLRRFSNLTYKCSTASHADVGQRHRTISVHRHSSIPVQPMPCISLTILNTNSSLAISNFNQDLFSICGGITVAITTRYGLDGPGIESWWGRDIPHPSRPALWIPCLLYNGHRVSFLGVKRPGRGVDHPPPSSAEVKERVDLYL